MPGRTLGTCLGGRWGHAWEDPGNMPGRTLGTCLGGPWEHAWEDAGNMPGGRTFQPLSGRLPQTFPKPSAIALKLQISTRSIQPCHPFSLELLIPCARRVALEGVHWQSDQVPSSHVPASFGTPPPNLPKTFGTRAQITDLDELYPTMLFILRETSISASGHILHFGTPPRACSGMTGVGSSLK